MLDFSRTTGVQDARRRKGEHDVDIQWRSCDAFLSSWLVLFFINPETGLINLLQIRWKMSQEIQALYCFPIHLSSLRKSPANFYQWVSWLHILVWLAHSESLSSNQHRWMHSTVSLLIRLALSFELNISHFITHVRLKLLIMSFFDCLWIWIIFILLIQLALIVWFSLQHVCGLLLSVHSFIYQLIVYLKKLNSNHTKAI